MLDPCLDFRQYVYFPVLNKKSKHVKALDVDY